MRTLRTILCSLLIVPLVLAGFPARASAITFDQNRIMDDVIFDNANTMTAQSINNFLNNFPNSCISPNKGFSAPLPIGYSPGTGYKYGGNASAGDIIYSAAQAYSINPQVLLATLQKEQGLVSGGIGCGVLRYAGATGYGCPNGSAKYNYSNVDLYTINGNTVTTVSGTCINSDAKVGFTQQLIRAAWLLKFSQQRAKGNISWAASHGDWNNSDDPQSCYSGPMTQGTWQRCPSGATTSYDGYKTIGGVAVHMDSGATAAFYWYTPNIGANHNLFNIFVGWFGSPYAGTCISSMTNSSTGVQFSQRNHSPATGHFIIYSGASTNCVEFHSWNNNLTSWSRHLASNSASIDTANGQVAFADLDGDGHDEAILVGLAHTGSGKIEFHVWDSEAQTWRAHITSNASTIDPTMSKVVFGDFDGDGKDEGALVGFGNGSTSTNKIEFHIWNPGFGSWREHRVTNSHTLDPAVSTVQVADLDGDGRDEGVLIGMGNGSTSTNRIEFHIWDYGFATWRSHIVSNSHTLDPRLSSIHFADLNGDGRDEALLVGDHKPTGSGRIEFHIWNPGFGTWSQHIISNQSAS